MSEPRRIAFHFSPVLIDNRMKSVEKEESGKKRRYLFGVTSGTKIDGAGERMTMKAIKSFQTQARSGDILLYSGKHGVDFIEDVGKLVDSQITPTGEWETTYRLYDELDEFTSDSVTLQKADKLWRQINGLPPYTVARKKGFSVEGVIPEAGGISTMDSAGRRSMDDVTLDGVVCVTRPAYRESVAMAVYKALDIDMPHQQKSILEKCLTASKQADDYFAQRLVLDSTMDDQIGRIITKSNPEREDELRTLFGAYGDLMVGVIMRSESVFKDDSRTASTGLGRATNRSRTASTEIVALGKLAYRVASRLRA